MGRQRAKPQPEAVILPPDLDDDDEFAGGGIPDEDGWIHLQDGTKRKEESREDEKPKRRTARRRSQGSE
jgi:hypothetical protein